MTNQLAAAILTLGVLPQFQFDNSTSTTNIYVTGRNSDSGTRLDAFAESGFGITSAPLQVDPTQNQAGSLVDHITSGAWVPGPNGVVFFTPPSNGYSSGGTLAGAMTATGSGTVLPGFLVTYLGINDANTTVAGGATILTYNGFGYSAAAVENGQYTFWAYEHFLKCPALSAAAATDPHVIVANALATQIVRHALPLEISGRKRNLRFSIPLFS
jgi:hypothetical protein